MGKRDKKKKGQGIEKTAVKTEKNLSKKLKRQLNKKGEESVEQMVRRLAEVAELRKDTAEHVCGPPSPRSSCSLCVHPEKDEILLYGGEFFNGKNTTVYGDLYQYRVKSSEWRHLQYPRGPPPRCAHAAAAAPLGGGQMWLFGGEFSSPSGEQFHHYRDLWCLHINQKRWEKVSAKDGPSARSGHRMVYHQKQLIVFGGFHDNLQQFEYFNDLHAFDLEKREWRKLIVTGTGPSPRSGVVFQSLQDGRILLFGGYSKQKVKKNVEQGTSYSDMFLLTPDKHDLTMSRWRWSAVKQSGAKPDLRSGMSGCCIRGDHLIFFGGVTDEETADQLSGTFHNDMYVLDAGKGIWNTVALSGRRDPAARRRRRRRAADGPGGTGGAAVDDDEAVGSSSVDASERLEQLDLALEAGPAVVAPSPRAKAALAARGTQLFLYGGHVEKGQQEVTLSDFYQLDVSKMDEWKTLVEQPKDVEWEGSEDEDDSMGEDEEEDESDEEDDSDESDEEQDGMDTDDDGSSDG